MLAPQMPTAELISQLAAATRDNPVLLGRCQVTGLIGAGGMGMVYDAIDLDHGTHLALKTLTSLDPAHLLRFKNEFRSVADLSHPNLISLYELNRYEDLWFFTMDRIEGVDFVEWLRGAPLSLPPMGHATVVGSPQGARKLQNISAPPSVAKPHAPPSIAKVRDALAQLIAGVHALHQAGFLHLDLKPSNVLVDTSGQVFVLDFGLIRRVDEPREQVATDDESFRISGTPMWMAPEQFTSAAIGKATDWYAVGLILYWALTGVPAFPPEATANEAKAARERREPVPAVVRVRDVPLDLSELAQALLQPATTQRPKGRTLLELTAAAETLATKQRGTFVGRQPELEVLRLAHAHVKANGARIVHVSGASGLGKTSLCRRFGEELATDKDTVALRSRCYERETVPYKAFDGLLDQLAALLELGVVTPELPAQVAELVQVFPVLASVSRVARALEQSTPDLVGVVERRRRAVQALCELFHSVARLRPLVLQIDDLQWADRESVALLVELLGGPALTRILLVLSFRSKEAQASEVLAPYFDVCHARAEEPMMIELQPLGALDAESLANHQLDALSVGNRELALAIAKESGGNPFFVEELAYFAAQGRDRAGSNAVSVGISLDDVLAKRVKNLPKHERALVEVLAVANSPIPLHIAFAQAGLQSEALRSLWALRAQHLIRTTGAGSNDLVELHHDRMRESVLHYLSEARSSEIHLGLALAFAKDQDSCSTRTWLFDCVRHFARVHTKLSPEQRLLAAQLNLAAASKARHAGAFGLAFECFEAGTALLDEAAWSEHYDLILALHSGAAETAHFSASWQQLDVHTQILKTRGRSILDKLVGWEVHIDACIARKDFAGSIAVAIQALHLLDTELPANPSEAEVGAAVQEAMQCLATIGPEGLRQLANADDPRRIAIMRIMSSISSAAYFVSPSLLAVLACRLVVASVQDGLSSVTAYALSVYGIVLNTLGLHEQAHTWGQMALEILERFDDMRADARTRHVIHDFVCVWTVPLSTAVPKLREVVQLCRSIGDVEYAGFASHGYVHNALYAGMDLQPLYDDALELGDFMRRHQQVSALHVHEPFEQLLRSYLGLNEDPSSLNGNGFSEEQALAASREYDSGAGIAVINMVMGIARYSFGRPVQAHACFSIVRQMLHAIPSIWHQPIFHQFAALSIYGLPKAERDAHLADAETSIAALRHLASQGPANFAHRVALVEAERARAMGNYREALKGFADAISQAEAGGWIHDTALAHELAAKCSTDQVRLTHQQAAQAAWRRWGAVAKVSQRHTLGG